MQVKQAFRNVSSSAPQRERFREALRDEAGSGNFTVGCVLWKQQIDGSRNPGDLKLVISFFRREGFHINDGSSDQTKYNLQPEWIRCCMDQLVGLVVHHPVWEMAVFDRNFS